MNSTLPLILAIETATPVSSVALFSGEVLLGCQEYTGERVHAKLLTTMIASVVSDCGFQLKDLHAVAVSKGPGSYTGLRVGVSTAKGLCMALNLPLISYGSLASLALQVQELARHMDALICPMIDARRMEVYSEVLDANGNVKEPVKATILDEKSFATFLEKEKVIFIGSGAAKCKALLETNWANALVLGSVLSTAKSGGKICHDKFSQQQFEDLATFEPYYLKEFATTVSKKIFE